MKAAPVPKRKEMSEILWGALTEQFQRKGLKCDRASIDKYTRQMNWQCKQSWSERDREDFRLWLEKYLVAHGEPPTNAVAILKMYGWELDKH